MPVSVAEIYPKSQLPLFRVLCDEANKNNVDLEYCLSSFLNDTNLDSVIFLNDNDNSKFIQTRILILDLLIMWSSLLRQLSITESLCIKDENIDYDDCVPHMVATISDKLLDDLLGIRILILRNLDFQARQLARAISESIDAFFLLLDSKEARMQFIKCKSPQESKNFYFRYISKQKARKAYSKFLENKSQDPKFSDPNLGWLSLEEEILSTSVHPTKTNIILKEGRNLLEVPGVYPSYSEYSERTLRFISLRCLQIIPISVLAGLNDKLSSFEFSGKLQRELRLQAARRIQRELGRVLSLGWILMCRAETEKAPF